MGRALGTQTGAGSAGVERQYHTDQQGNVLAISDDSQATAVTYQMDPFGNVRSGSATDQPLDFVGGQGYQRDPDAGTVYVRARHYDPTTGEWLSADPIEGEPPYAYGYNSPTVFTDRSGMEAAQYQVLLPDEFMDTSSEANRRYREYQQGKALWLLANPPEDMWWMKYGEWQQLSASTRVQIWAKHNRGKGLFRVVPSCDNGTSIRAVRPGERLVPVSGKPISQMGDMEKIREAICRAVPSLPGAVGDQVLGMVRDGRTWATIVVCLGAWGIGHYFGYGELIDLGLITYAYIQIGEGAVAGAEELVDFVATARAAKTDADLKVASKHFANAVGILTIDGVAVLLTRGAPKAAKADIKAVTARVRAKGVAGLRGTPDLPPIRATAGAVKHMDDLTRGGVKRSAQVDALNAIAVARARSVLLDCLREAFEDVTRRRSEGGPGMIEGHGEFGNTLHAELDRVLQRRGLENMRSEVSYSRERAGRRFEGDTIRLDVAIYERFAMGEQQLVRLGARAGQSSTIVDVYDLRTGSAVDSFDAANRARIRVHLPKDSKGAAMHVAGILNM